jgi:hypothetical protein
MGDRAVVILFLKVLFVIEFYDLLYFISIVVLSISWIRDEDDLFIHSNTRIHKMSLPGEPCWGEVFNRHPSSLCTDTITSVRDTTRPFRLTKRD